MRADLAYAARTLRRAPGFVAVAAATLALGIGANTAIFSLVNAVLLRPLPYPDPPRVVRVFGTTAADRRDSHSGADVLDLRERSSAFTAMAAWTPARFTLVQAGGPQAIDGASVTDAFFDVFGALPARGRFFHHGDARDGGPARAVLGFATWRDRFASDPGVIDRVVTLNRKPVTIVGVAAADFVAPEPHDIWVLDGELPTPPFGAADGAERQREVRYLQLVARIRPDVGPDAALQDLRRVAGLLAAEHPDTNRDRGYRLVALADDLTGDVRPGLLMLSGAVGFLLLIACANVGNLALARATTREKEMAVRRALGAGTLRLLRLVVAEQLVVAVAGAALGIVLTLWGLDALLALTPVPLPRADQVRVDAGVVVFGALLAIIAAVAVGVVTTVGRLDDRLDAALRDSTRSTTSSGRQRVRAVLVVAEIALATVLVIGAALLAKSFVRLQAVAPGFEPAGLLTVALPLPQPQYADPAVQHAFYRDVQAGVSRLPGVIGAALAFPLPLSLGGDAYVGIALEGSAYDADAEQRRAGLNWVTPGYFRTMHVRLVAGRDFDERDIAGRRRVAIVNGQMVQRFFGGRDPIGHELQVGQAEEDRLTVVGVVSDVSARRAGDPPQPEVYIPIHQHAFPFMTLLVRTTGAPETAAGPVREVVRRLDPELAVGQVRPYGDVIERTVSQPRFRTWLLLIFGGLALLLAALGIYGVMSYAVSQRIREFGVRLALGAARRDVYLLVLRQGAVLAGAGLALGMALALVLSRALRSMLFEVAPHDPLVLAGVAALLGLVALSACAMPAFRATRVDPLDALRVE